VQQGTTLEKNIAAVAPSAKIIAFRDYTPHGSRSRRAARTHSRAASRAAGILEGQSELQIVGELFSVEPFGIGVRQGDSDLRDEINFAIQDLWISGEYAMLFRKWFNAEPTVPIEVAVDRMSMEAEAEPRTRSLPACGGGRPREAIAERDGGRQEKSPLPLPHATRSSATLPRKRGGERGVCLAPGIRSASHALPLRLRADLGQSRPDHRRAS